MELSVYNKNHWSKVICTTPVCGNRGNLELIGDWQTDDYCKYIMVLCPDCHAKYWMVKREETYKLKWRQDGEDFDNRKDVREGN